MAGKTPTEMAEALSTAMVEITEGRVHRWQEADKRGELHRLDHLAKAYEVVKGIEDEDAEEQNTTAVSFLC